MSPPRIAVIGSGPTGIYTLRGLVASKVPLSIDIFEVEQTAGWGTPYHPDVNDKAMLANIASIELPPVYERLAEWLTSKPDEQLSDFGVRREAIGPREFYPRIVIGEYFKNQFDRLVASAEGASHAVTVRTSTRVIDLELQKDDILLTSEDHAKNVHHGIYDHVVMATGHNWPAVTEIKPGYYMSPWPAKDLKKIGPTRIGILGTSLSGIDALVAVATAHGTFYHDPSGELQYEVRPCSENFAAVMMSRKGLLPEADFYCDYPYKPLVHCTNQAIDDLIARESLHLLDEVFELFKKELSECDPEYADKINLASHSVETIASAYYAEREAADPFVWAALNLAEAAHNKSELHTVPWRYAILRMHEVVGRAVPFFNQVDLKRFNKSLKSIFVDDYATVPHQSIARLLALRRAGKLDIIALGNDYKIQTGNVSVGAEVKIGSRLEKFEAFIDATGQNSMSAADLPFPTLVKQDLIKAATTEVASDLVQGDDGAMMVRSGGMDLDDAFRPIFTQNLCNHLYCVAISFLLYKRPFVQGITSAEELGTIASKAILTASSNGDVEAANRPSRFIITDV